MAFPTPPEIVTSYTAAEQALGDGTLPGQELDVDLAAVRASIAAVIEFVKGITRSDGKLANGIVSKDALSGALIIGFDSPKIWATATAYTTSSTVFEGFKFYLCIVAHTSTVFATDLASGRWSLLADLTPPGGALIAANNFTDVPDKPNARLNLGLGSMATLGAGVAVDQFRNNLENDGRFQLLDADLTSWAAIARAAGFDAFAATPNSANLRTLLTDETGTGALLFAGGAMGTPSSLTLTNATGTPASLTLTNATGLPFAGLAAAAVVTAAETIAANNNDTTVPTSAAVKAYADGLNTGATLLETLTMTGTVVTMAQRFSANKSYLFEVEDLAHNGAAGRILTIALFGETAAAFSVDRPTGSGITSTEFYYATQVLWFPKRTQKLFTVEGINFATAVAIGTDTGTNYTTGRSGALIKWGTAQSVSHVRFALDGAGSFTGGTVKVWEF